MLCYQFKFVITFNHVKPVKPVNPINPVNPYQRIEAAVYARVVNVDVAGRVTGAVAVGAVAFNVHSSYVHLLKNDYFLI